MLKCRLYRADPNACPDLPNPASVKNLNLLLLSYGTSLEHVDLHLETLLQDVTRVLSAPRA